MSQAWGLCCSGTSIRPTHPLSKSHLMSTCRGQLVPMCAGAELCQDILVKMICLLWGSRGDVEKTAPSQLLQGVLQCRGVTEKYGARRQFVHSQSLTLVLHLLPYFVFFSSSLLPLLFYFCSTTSSLQTLNLIYFAIHLLYTCTHRLFRHWLYFGQSLLQQ